MTAWLDDGDAVLYHGDALEVLRELPSGSVHMCATSPPFYGLRDYGVGGQIGLEDSPQAWVERLVAVFREVRRVLRDDGTLWVEIGDSYAQYDGQGNKADPRPDGMHGTFRVSQALRDTAEARGDRHSLPPGYKRKDLLGQPWMLAKALRDPYYTGKIKDERDRIWLAAMIDAEGSIGIHRRPAGQRAYSTFEKKDGTTSKYVRKTDSYQPKVEISNTSRAIMDRVVAIAGGNCDTKEEAGTHGRKQTLYRWTLTADKCRDLLRELYPHLVGKQHEARLAIGCPSSGDKAAAAHEALKLLHGGSTTGIDFPAPESMWEAGWYLRSEIIWARLRPNPMPESVTDRPTKSHSTVFLLSKSPRYFYDAAAIREPSPEYSAGWARSVADRQHGNGETSQRGSGGGVHRMGDLGQGANARSVWTIPTEPTPFAHFATWPRKLVARMIQAGTSERGCCPECGAPWVRETEREGGNWEERKANGLPMRAGFSQAYPGTVGTSTTRTLGWSPSCDCAEGGGVLSPGRACGPASLSPVPCTVLDPFAGSGTTSLVARHHGRHAIGIELNEDYCRIAADRLAQLSLLAEPA